VLASGYIYRISKLYFIMVVGNGLVATAFSIYRGDADKIIFASGVSNSSFANQQEADREYELLRACLKEYPDQQLVYFSTASIYDPSLQGSFYIRHKSNIENYIIANVPRYLIIRASNIVGGGVNPHTLVNRFIHQLSNNEAIEVWKHSTRNLIGLADFFSIVDTLLKQQFYKNTIINVANPNSYSVLQIVDVIAQYLHVTPKVNVIEKGASYSIDISTILPIIHNLGLRFTADYLGNLLKHYYS